MNAVRHDPNPVSRVFQKLLNLSGSKIADRNDKLGVFRSVIGLGSESLAKFRGRILCGEHKKIMKGSDTRDLASFWQALI
jgi:hypothetical protein